MKQLINLSKKNQKIVSIFGTIAFNSEGIAEVEDAVADTLSTLKGYTVKGAETPQNGSKPDAQELNQEVSPKSSEDTSEVVVTTEYSSEELNSKTVPELRKLAISLGCDVTGLSKKVDFISAITAVTVAD